MCYQMQRAPQGFGLVRSVVEVPLRCLVDETEVEFVHQTQVLHNFGQCEVGKQQRVCNGTRCGSHGDNQFVCNVYNGFKLFTKFGSPSGGILLSSPTEV